MKSVIGVGGTVLALALLATGLVETQSTQQYVRYQQGTTTAWGELVGETIHRLSAAPYLDGSRRTGQTAPMKSVKLLAPAEPTQVIMTALNFLSHLGGQKPAQYPGLFIVPPHSVTGPDDPMYIFPTSTNLHYEAEAVIVIGKRAQNVPLSEARSYIFGITAGNDGSERNWQTSPAQNEGQWAKGKGADSFNPIGPVLVRGVNPNNVTIIGRVNGEERQKENTSDMIFNFDYMVSYISHFFTLEPGDLIWSGTPGTTQAMKAGDVYEVEIQGVTTLRTPIAAAPAQR